MLKSYYLVLKEFDSQKNYGIKIRKQYGKCLSIVKRGQKINQQDFASEYGSQFTKKNSQKSREEAVHHAFVVGKKIGVLRPLIGTELGYPISYSDFCKLGTVSYFMKQHRGSKLKNIESKDQGTRGTYAYKLWNFNNWLHKRDALFTKKFPSGKDTYKQKIEKVKLDGVEDLLNHYKQPLSQEREFVKIIKDYLLEPQPQ